MRPLSRVSAMFVVGAALVAPLLGAPETARAQYAPYGHVDRGVIRVDGVAPSRALPGERVTIRGAGFTASTQVFVGGQPAAIELVTHEALVFLAPAHAGDGRIVLRDPRAAGDTVVGALAIDVQPGYGYGGDPRYADPRYGDPRYSDPRYTDPRYGAPAYPAPTFGRVDFDPRPRGVRIVVEGRGFAHGDTLLVGGVPAEVRSLEGGRMVAWAPVGASGAVTWHCARDGRRYDTGAVVPTWGDGRGGRYGGYRDGRARYGDPRYAPGPQYAPGPPYAPYGRPRYAPYQPARIDSLTVQARRGGQVLVLVVGSGFGADARVLLGHIAAPVVSRSDRQLVVAVPRGVAGAMPVFVDTAGQRIAAADQVVLPR